MKSKKLGQCFLNSAGILEKEAELADVNDKTVIEIGSGDGRLTAALAEKVAKRIFAIEKDSKYAAVLRKRFATSKNVEVIEGDFLELELPEVERIIGNVPYYISAPILFRMARMKWQKSLLMLQKEFVDKMLAKPNESNYGRLSVMAQLHFEMQYVQTVSRRFFTPSPKVDSAIVLLTPTRMQISDSEEEIINLMFQHKNQSVAKALKHSKRFSEGQIAALGEFGKRRVRTLTKEECMDICKKLIL